jgi:hypothetical protein
MSVTGFTDNVTDCVIVDEQTKLAAEYDPTRECFYILAYCVERCLFIKLNITWRIIHEKEQTIDHYVVASGGTVTARPQQQRKCSTQRESARHKCEEGDQDRQHD